MSGENEPLKDLLKTRTNWKWGEAKNLAFEHLKKQTANIQPMKHYNINQQKNSATDASLIGPGAQILQNEVK